MKINRLGVLEVDRLKIVLKKFCKIKNGYIFAAALRK
jgi:hypothetical protein